MADLADILNTLIAEANGEGPEGMRRVGETILNRAAIRGITPAEVVRQPNQYTGYFAPGPEALVAQRDEVARKAAEAAWELARKPGDPTNGADHYHADYVSPYWANQLQSTGSYGQHQFYKSREVPADALAALLTRPAPQPASPSQSLQVTRAANAALGNMRTASTGAASIADMYAGIFPQSVTNAPNLTNGGIIDQTVNGLQQKQSLADALAAMLTPAPAQRTAAPMPTGVPQSYAGQERVSASSLFGADRGIPADGPVLASVPSRAPTPMPTGVTQTYAGQEGAVPPRMNGVGTMPGFSELAAAFAPKPPQANSSVNMAKTQDRLQPNAAAIDKPGVLIAHGLGTGMSATLPGGGSVPLPRERPNGGGQVQIVDRKSAPAPATRTITEQVINPAWREAQARIDPVGTMPTWGEFADTFVPKKEPPKYITVTKQVPVAPVKQQAAAQTVTPLRVTVNGGNVSAPARVPAPATRVDQLRAMGMGAAAAYDALNARANGPQSLEDRVTGRGTQSSSGASAYSISG
jgi:hypothetical protein